MALTMTFLGTGAAIVVEKNNYHSNVLLTCDGDTLLIDAGTDLRIALDALGLTHTIIRNLYITHQHFDHAGGLEWLALSAYFDTHYSGKPKLFAHETIIQSLTRNFSPGLCTLRDQCATLATYFDLNPLHQDKLWTWQSIQLKLIPMLHFYHGCEAMPCFGLFITMGSTKIFYTADTQFNEAALMPYYEKANIIFQDCEVLSEPSGIHAHYQQLRTLPMRIKKKMWLYHYNPGNRPDPLKDGFLGFVRCGQQFVF